ncbi:MAG: response regulator [Lachnospiraceae bacterium]|nr:response regulator [Lachnospiraceae bacterium]
MEKAKIHRLVISIVTTACVGLTVESIIEGWEFWVNILLICGVVCLWVFHISQCISERSRETFYLAYSMFAAFFHGVHSTSLLDIVTISCLMLIVFALYDKRYVLNLILAEYVILMVIQVFLQSAEKSLVLDSLTISRLVLQVVAEICTFVVCSLMVKGRQEQAEALARQNEDIAAYNDDMEDFLSNVSHELRTPVNVVNGMSMLLMKQSSGDELIAIQNAGRRLSDQIEDIQDYTEVKRDQVVLEEEVYMITSLVNDVVTDYRYDTEAENLELVIDLDPAVPSRMKGDVKKLGKILRHLLSNAIKFTGRGGIYIKISSMARPYGVNLIIEVTDTGIGMQRQDIAMAGDGMYQANKKRNRSTGGVGLGLSVVFGMAHKMGGFVKIESENGMGTTVRVTVPQEIEDDSYCLAVAPGAQSNIVFHVRSNKYKIPAIREFYRQMATNMAIGLRLPLYSADTIKEVKNLLKSLKVSHIFMGEEEYLENAGFFDELSNGDTRVAVSAKAGFKANPGSRVIVMPKPLYAFPVVRVLNGESLPDEEVPNEGRGRMVFEGVRCLIVDDEPMNLVVATGLLQEYRMVTDTAAGGRESVDKYEQDHYDIVFMDHMMPGMDGVEAMKLIRESARRADKKVIIVALTANAVSGAREMFIQEGFDGFIAKPIDLAEFERVMKRVLPPDMVSFEGGDGA